MKIDVMSRALGESGDVPDELCEEFIESEVFLPEGESPLVEWDGLDDSDRRPELINIQETYAARARVLSENSGKIKTPEELISLNYGLVRTLSLKFLGFRSGGMGLNDIIQYGNMGLMKAAHRYDPNHESRISFGTYARWRILDSIQRGMVVSRRTIYIPNHVSVDITQLLKSIKKLEKTFHRDPLPEELADDVGMTVEKVLDRLDCMEDATSLQEIINEQGGELSCFIKNEKSLDPFDGAIQGEYVRKVEVLLGMITPRQREIIVRTFGINPEGKEESQEALAEEFNVSKQAISAAKKKALNTMLGGEVKKEELGNLLYGAF